jgi:hypothetical protein
MKRILILFLFTQFLVGTQVSFAQKVYRNEMGGIITREQYEKQILEGPYFGVPGKDADEQVLVHRMPFGQIANPIVYYEKTDNLEAFNLGKSLIVIYYPGKDECNSTGMGNNSSTFKKEHETLLKWAEKENAANPIYLYSRSEGLKKYGKSIQWNPDPEMIFAREFFKFPYPCGSFVVIHPSGNYRSILGEYPLSQIQVALKNLNRGFK